MYKHEIVIHIPAREGSKRVPHKNLRYLVNKPLISYSIEAAKQSGLTDEIYVNSDSDLLLNLADAFGVKGYKRSSELASDTATSDQFNMDIINSLKPKVLIMINPVCPLIEASDIINAYQKFNSQNIDTLITVNSTKMQGFYQREAINFNIDEHLVPTQNNEPVLICNWAVTIWNAESFRKRYEKDGNAVFGKNRYLMDIDHTKSIKVSNEQDFLYAEKILQAMQLPVIEEKKYWSSS